MVEKKRKIRSTNISVDPATQYAQDVHQGKIFVAERIAEIAMHINMKAIAFDPYRIKYLELKLDHAGVRFP